VDRVGAIMKIIIVSLLSLILASCVSTKKCDCEHVASTAKENKMTATGEHEKSPKKEAAIVVDREDIEISNRMSKAVDAFVFKNQNEDFKTLCEDKRFDCFVNDKRFPSGRKKIKRKVPPYLSGAKMGLQGENRIRVKYDFYP